MNKLAERIKELRLEKGLSQAELAKALSVTQTALGKWELGQRSPNVDMIINICNYFKVSSDYLIGLED